MLSMCPLFLLVHPHFDLYVTPTLFVFLSLLFLITHFRPLYLELLLFGIPFLLAKYSTPTSCFVASSALNPPLSSPILILPIGLIFDPYHLLSPSPSLAAKHPNHHQPIRSTSTDIRFWNNIATFLVHLQSNGNK